MTPGMIDRPPLLTGVRTFNDRLGRFHLRIPTDWRQHELEEDRDGALFAPDPADPDTHISIWVSELEQAATAGDLPDLQLGVRDGLARLPGARVETARDDCLGNLVKLERVLTFRRGRRTAKRRTWMLFVERWRIVLTYQGSTAAIYEHWSPIGTYAFATFNVAEELWFTTDRELGPR